MAAEPDLDLAVSKHEPKIRRRLAELIEEQGGKIVYRDLYRVSTRVPASRAEWILTETKGGGGRDGRLGVREDILSSNNSDLCPKGQRRTAGSIVKQYRLFFRSTRSSNLPVAPPRTYTQHYQQRYRSNLKNTSLLSSDTEIRPPYSDLLEIDAGCLFLKGPSRGEGLGWEYYLRDLPDLVLAPRKKSKRPTPIPEPLDVGADAAELCKRLEAIVRECGGRVAVTMNALHRVRGPAWVVW
jgi:hypothetical protein